MTTAAKTLRDEFAMAALIGLLAESARDKFDPCVTMLTEWTEESYGECAGFAQAAYRLADAMLAARDATLKGR